MSTGNISLDILINQIQEDAISNSGTAVKAIQRKYPKLTEAEATEIFTMISSFSYGHKKEAELVVTAPPSFSIRTKATKNTVEDMIKNAKSSILITGYSLSDYFDELVDCIVRKSQEGVFVKFFVNDIESQGHFDKLLRYKGRFLKIYNYPKGEDKMSALHAKVISVDRWETLITSANLSYHGQEGNIELGTHIFSDSIAKQIDDVFTGLLFKKVFVEI